MIHCFLLQSNPCLLSLNCSASALFQDWGCVSRIEVVPLVGHIWLTIIIKLLCRHNRISGNLASQGPPTEKTALSGGKTKKKLPKFFLRLRDTCKKYILQKNWVKTAIPALSSGRNNLQTPIWGHHCQLDDQHRNPNMNNKDHHVGQLTRSTPVH